MKKELRTYRTKEGDSPFTDWLGCLKDSIGKAQITNRLNRVVLGNYGDYKSVGEGVLELRIHTGPGYRLYVSEQEHTILLLLIGGTKRTQDKDIKRAKKYLAEFRERFYD
jgi:putative addiction module killer protein